MPSTYIERLAQLAATGQPFVSVTLVESIGSTPQDAGTKMLVTVAGLAHGTIGGGKVEHKALEQAQRLLTEEGAQPRLFVEWNLQTDIGMTCGGAVKLYFETYHLHDWHVVVFGAGHVAQALVHCLAAVDCRITCIDTRQEWLDRLPTSTRLRPICSVDPRLNVQDLSASDFVVCMTMGHGTDLPILAAIAKRGLQPAYLGVIGSRAKRKVLLRELAELGFNEAVLGPLHCPIGLPLGSNQPAEIAISIAAQMLQTRDAIRGSKRTGA